jgi:chromosome segregation ATPase
VELKKHFDIQISKIQEEKNEFKSEIDSISLKYLQLETNYSEAQRSFKSSEASLNTTITDLQLLKVKLQEKVESKEVKITLKDESIDELKINLADLQIKYNQALTDLKSKET